MSFKEEYESLNGEKNVAGVEHRKVSIDIDNPFVYITAEELIKKIENKDTFYVYFGDSQCPWCRSVIEKSIEIAKKNNIKEIYYVKIWDNNHNGILRDKYEVDDAGKVKLISKGTDSYYKILELFDNVLTNYTLTDNNGIEIEPFEKRIYAPNYIYVSEGKAFELISGISDMQTGSRSELTEEILADQEKIFNAFFSR